MIATTLTWAALATTVPALAAQSSGDGVRWDWSQPHRYAIETRIRLPEMMWLATRFNRQARVDVMDLRMVTQCAPGEKENRRVWEVHCVLEDVSFSAEALPQEAGIVAEIVTEFDRLMTGATVQLQVREDGRLVNVDLEDMERRNRRFGQINENIRLILSRGFAGFDLPLPKAGGDDGWIQSSSWIMRAPETTGSAGASELGHKVTGVGPDTVQIATAGRGIIIPGEGINKYAARVHGEATFDRTNGRLLDRVWTLVGGPTASSFIAQGTEGYPYVVEGRIVALPEGQSWDVGESRELERSEAGKTAIQQSFMGQRIR